MYKGEILQMMQRAMDMVHGSDISGFVVAMG